MTPRMDKSAAPEFHSSSWALHPWSVWTFSRWRERAVALGVPGESVPHQPDVAMDLGRALEALQGHQLPLVGDGAVAAEAICSDGISGEDAPHSGGPGHEVIQGAPAGGVALRRLNHLSILHPVMRTLEVPVARVVAFPELAQDPTVRSYLHRREQRYGQ